MRQKDSVFINCPFDVKYSELFRAIVFTVIECEMRPRCAREVEDAGQVRILKIYKIVADCVYGIHDISRTSLDPATRLPRFNMPFELGLFLGAKEFGSKLQQAKMSLILDKKPFRYQKFISDIAGQDIRSHFNEPKTVVRIVRDWIQTSVHKNSSLPLMGGAMIWRRYRTFRKDLPKLCRTLKLGPKEITYSDYVWLAENWVDSHQ
jgi:hypothetical protein